MGGYNYKILIFESINELKLRKMTFNCQYKIHCDFPCHIFLVLEEVSESEASTTPVKRCLGHLPPTSVTFP